MTGAVTAHVLIKMLLWVSVVILQYRICGPSKVHEVDFVLCAITLVKSSFVFFSLDLDLCLVHTADTDKTRQDCLVLSVSVV